MAGFYQKVSASVPHVWERRDVVPFLLVYRLRRSQVFVCDPPCSVASEMCLTGFAMDTCISIERCLEQSRTDARDVRKTRSVTHITHILATTTSYCNFNFASCVAFHIVPSRRVSWLSHGFFARVPAPVIYRARLWHIRNYA